jgi:hypothetical protein
MIDIEADHARVKDLARTCGDPGHGSPEERIAWLAMIAEAAIIEIGILRDDAAGKVTANEEAAQAEANRRKPLPADALASIERDIAAADATDPGVIFLDACMLLREVRLLHGAHDSSAKAALRRRIDTVQGRVVPLQTKIDNLYAILLDVLDEPEPTYTHGHAAGVAEERTRVDKLFASELENWDDGDRTWTALTELREWITRSAAIEPHR